MTDVTPTNAASERPPPAGPALASPPTLLLDEEQRGDRQAEEVLLLSFTTDLGFFEAVGLGVAQACGARVTVVGDAAMSAADPRAVRRAGRSYLPGYAACRGAFHPKLVAVVGPHRATVAIGSGNLTMAGWQANAELWTVLRGDRERAPTALTDLVGWLQNLPDHVRFSRGVPEALNRVADGLASLCEQADRADTDIRLVSTSEGPILDQLPAGPVEELAVCAPFHDPGAVALRRLVTRFKPNRLVASYQPALTQLDGPALAGLAAELQSELRLDGESRYRHGKLIEWVSAGRRYALTGSPNLSGAALLEALADGGNCELALITPVEASLLPAGTSVPATTIRTMRFTARPRSDIGPLLLGATRVEHGLHVMFARATPKAGHIELSPAAAPPETWERVGEVPAHSTEVTLTVAADGGSRVRLVTVAGGEPRHSNLVFVVDPARAQRRPGITAAHMPTTRPDDLFNDPRLAERFTSDLAALAASLAQPPSATTVAAEGGSARSQTSVDRDRDGWERYLDECAGRLGHPLLRFALGLPALPDTPEPGYEALLPVSWDEQLSDDTEAGLDDDNAESVSDQPDNLPAITATLPDLRRESIVVRRRYRNWARQLAQAAPHLATAERMLVTRLLLWTAAAGAWDHDDHAWLDLLADAVRELGTVDLRAEAEPQVASLAAVALAVLRAEAPRHVSTPETLAFTRAARAVDYLLVAADPTYTEQYSHLLETAFGPAVTPEAIHTLAAEIVQADPVADAVWALAEQGRDAHRHGGHLLHVTGSFNNALLVALQAIGAAEDADLVGAWATSTSSKWALIIWRKPDLITIDSSGPIVLWRHYRLGGLLSPRSLAAQRSLDGARSVPHGPFVRAFPEALELLERLGLSGPQPPAQCRDQE